jgi:glucokinase
MESELMSKKTWGGVDIGGTKTAVVVSSQLPAIHTRIQFPTMPAAGPEPALERIIASMHEAVSSQQLCACDLYSIGISCGSPLDPVKGVIQSPPNLPTWKDVPIKSILEEEFQVPCFLENDANAGALAELWFGAGRGVESMVFLTMGTGLGAGLILDGRLYRGASHLAGEIGHVRLRRSGPRAYGKAGSAEAWASGAGMTQVAERVVRAASARGEATQLAHGAEGDASPRTARDIWEAAQNGDVVAQHIVQITGERLGAVLAILVDILNPERIVIGGLAVRMGEALLGPAREVVEREGLPGTVSACQIVPAALGEEIGDVAALCVALNAETDTNKKELLGLVTS